MGLGKRSPASDVTQPEPSGGTAGVVAVLAIAVFMSSLDLFIVNLAFPSIGEEYAGAGLGALSWILNAYTVVFSAVLVPPDGGPTGSDAGAHWSRDWPCSPSVLCSAASPRAWAGSRRPGRRRRAEPAGWRRRGL